MTPIQRSTEPGAPRTHEGRPHQSSIIEGRCSGGGSHHTQRTKTQSNLEAKRKVSLCGGHSIPSETKARAGARHRHTQNSPVDCKAQIWTHLTKSQLQIETMGVRSRSGSYQSRSIDSTNRLQSRRQLERLIHQSHTHKITSTHTHQPFIHCVFPKDRRLVLGNNISAKQMATEHRPSSRK